MFNKVLNSTTSSNIFLSFFKKKPSPPCPPFFIVGDPKGSNVRPSPLPLTRVVPPAPTIHV